MSTGSVKDFSRDGSGYELPKREFELAAKTVASSRRDRNNTVRWKHWRYGGGNSRVRTLHPGNGEKYKIWALKKVLRRVRDRWVMRRAVVVNWARSLLLDRELPAPKGRRPLAQPLPGTLDGAVGRRFTFLLKGRVVDFAERGISGVMSSIHRESARRYGML